MWGILEVLKSPSRIELVLAFASRYAAPVAMVTGSAGAVLACLPVRYDE